MISSSSSTCGVRPFHRFLVSLVMWCAVVSTAHAATSELRILMNTDVDTASGCDVVTPDGTFEGVEQMLVTTVETTGSTGQVVLVERRECVDPGTDTFGAAIPVSAGGWDVGVGLGLDGSDVVETFVDIADIGGADPPPVIRLGLVGDNGTAEDALLTVQPTGNQPILLNLATSTVVEIPTVTEWGLILLALLLSLLALRQMRRMGPRGAAVCLLLVCMGVTVVAWASVRDGMIDDWMGISPLAEDPEADAPAGADLRALFAQVAGGEICFRIDAFLEFNEAPTAVDDAFTVDEDSVDNSLDVLANDTDPEMDMLTITGVGTPDQGGVAMTDGSTISYSPQTDFKGTETFTYTIDDGNGGMDTATVTVTVENVNDDPTAVDDSFMVDEDSTDNSLDVLANDTFAPDMMETLTITAVGMPDQGGTAMTDGSTVTYSPAADFAGVETFTYTISDGNGGTDAATVTVTVDNLNDPPTAMDDSFMVDEDSTDNSLDVLANDVTAPDMMETLTITAVGMPDQGGTAMTDGSTVTYSPPANFVGIETFSYTIQDGNGGSDMATVTVTVNNTNEDPPVCSADAATTDEDNSTLVDVLANDTDPDPMDTLTVLSVDDTGTTGTVMNNGTDVTYDPNGQFDFLDDGEMDTDTFSYTAQDSTGRTCMATVTVTITGVNDAPMVMGEIFDVAAGNFEPVIGNTTLQFANSNSVTTPHRFVSGDVLDNDSDPEGEGLTITAFDATSTEGGAISFNMATGEFTYEPPVGFEGTDSFGYTVTDGTAAVMGTVTLEIADMVWYIDNDPANDGSGDDGRSASGFDTIAQFEAENGVGGADDPEAGDVIFIFQGTSTYDAGGGDLDGLDLLDQQKLLGEGVDLVVQGLTLVSGSSANQPSIDNTNGSGDAVTVLADTADRTGIEIRGLSIDGTDNAVEVTSANAFQVGVTISDNTIAGSGAEGLHFNPGSSGAFVTTVENNVFSTSSSVGNAIDVTTAAASGDVEVTFNANTDITSSGGAGIVLDNSAGGGDLFVTGFAGNTVHGNTTGDGIRILGATFDADPGDPDFNGDEVSGGNTTVGVGNPVGGSAMVLTNVEGDLAFGALNLSTDGMGSVGLDVTGNGTLNAGMGTGFEITNTSGTISSTNGPAVILDPLTAGLSFSSVSSSNSPTVGVSLVDVAGTFSATGGSITGATGTSFNVNGGAPGVTYNGSITHGSNGTRAIEIQSMAGGSASFGGAVNATDGTGIRIANNTGTNPIGFTSTVDLGTSISRISDGTALTMTGNSGGTTVTIPDLDVFTSGQTAVNASGSGTLDADELSINTVSNGRALDLDGILSLVDVDSVSCSHNSNCVDLTSLAATSNTTFAGVGLTCTGGTCFNASSARTVEVTGTGNTISATNAVGLNMTSTTIGGGHATFESISASGAANGIVLNNTGSTGDFTITGDGNNANDASGGTIQDTSDHGIVLTQTEDISLTSIRVANPGDAASEHGIFATDLRGNNLLRSSTVTGFDQASGDGLRLVNNNVNLGELRINGSTFTTSDGNDGVAVFAQGTSTMSVVVENQSLFTDLEGDAIDIIAGDLAGSTATVNLMIDDNDFTNAGLTGNGGVQARVGNDGTLTGSITNNTFNDTHRLASTAGVIEIQGNNTGSVNLTVQGNDLDTFNQSGINVVADDASDVIVVIDGNFIDTNQNDKIGIRSSIRNTGITRLTIQNNQVGQTTALPGTAGTRSAIDIEVFDDSGATDDVRILIDNNQLRVNKTSGTSEVMDIFVDQNADADLTITNNTLTNLNAGDGAEIVTDSGSTTLCLDLRSNTATNPGPSTGDIELIELAGVFSVEALASVVANNPNANIVFDPNMAAFSNAASCATP